jgi:hypothetical protein
MSPKNSYPELTNLLPLDRIAGLRREYYIHLATIGMFTLAAVIIGSGALLMPAYLYLNQQIQSREATVAGLDARLANSEGKAETKRLATLSASATYLARLATSTSATGAMGGVLAVPRTGITLTGISYTPPVHASDGKMVLTGMASTRETLRTYDQALTDLPFVSNVDLPISSYAKDTDIPFAITLTGTLTP